MQKLKQSIISLLEQKGTELSTAEIMQNISKEYVTLKVQGKNNEARKLHRNILYHLNMLVRENILKVERFGTNGQKFYVINIAGGEQLSSISPSRYKKRLEESVSFMPAIPIEGYESKEIVIKYGNLVDKLNSVVVLCDKYAEDLDPLVKKLLFIVDDCVCLENFETEINKGNAKILVNSLNNECGLYGKKVSFSINISNVEKDRLLALVKETATLPNIHYIFGVEQNSLLEKVDLISGLLEIYAKEKKRIFIKNRDKFDIPYFVGNAGVYSFDKKEWESMQEKPICIACSQSTVIIDVKKFYDNYGFNFARFKELLLNVSKAFLSTNSILRKKIRDYFKDKIPNYNRDFLELSRNYIRLWNFGLLDPELEKGKVLDIIHKSKERIDEFARIQDRIFNSCGMPIRFKTALNQASKRAKEGLSSAKDKQMQVEGVSSIIEKLGETIEETGKISSYFDGGVHVTFDRIGKAKNSKELFAEISLLINKHYIGFFSYNFGGLEYGGN